MNMTKPLQKLRRWVTLSYGPEADPTIGTVTMPLQLFLDLQDAVNSLSVGDVVSRATDLVDGVQFPETVLSEPPSEDDKDSRIAELERELERESQHHSETLDRLDAAVADCDALAAKDARIAELEREVKAFRQSNEEWQATAGDAFAEAEAAQHQSRSWESNYNTLKAENAHLRSRITEGMVCPTCKADFSERDALAAKVRAGLALAEEWDGIETWPNEQGVFEQCAAQVRAALIPDAEPALSDRPADAPPRGASDE